MNRRDFMATGLSGVVGADLLSRSDVLASPARQVDTVDPRDLFPRLQHDVYLNAAAGTPLSTFAERGLRAYEDYWRLGPDDGRGARAAALVSRARTAFARLIGAEPAEVALVHCTKAGEQIVLDGLPALRHGGTVVTNEYHFSGSLHNLVGLQRAGLNVHIVRGAGWQLSVEEMEDAIDERTALVDVTLVSNVNGRVEQVRRLADRAHAVGALVYADIIQAAGIVPIDVRALGIDFAACSGYKWLYGPHGVGFLYVRRDLQGTALPDHLYPGHVRHNYRPWTPAPDPGRGTFTFDPPTDASRYQPGHISYLGYAAVAEGLSFIEEVGVESLQRHSLALCRRLLDGVDRERYRPISPDPLEAPIVTFVVGDAQSLAPRLRSANLVVSLGANTVRVSPAIYNTADDVDLLLAVLNG